MKHHEMEAKHRKVLDRLDLGDYMGALGVCDRMLKAQPDSDHWNYMKGMALLFMGSLKSGLNHNEWRLEKYGSWARATGLRLWEGEKDARLFVSYEQGVADECQWLPVLHDLRAMGLPALVQADARLLPAVERTFGDSFEYCASPKSEDKRLVYSGNWKIRDFGCTHVLPMGSLPYFFRREWDDFRKFKPLVHAPSNFEKGPGLNVGLAWRSRAEREMYTRLEQWDQLFKLRDVTVWNLQYDKQELDIVQAGLPIREAAGLDTFDDLDGVGAFMSLLDVIISPTNAISKLAGALGFRTYMLLDKPDHIQFGQRDFPLLPTVTCFTRTDYEGGWVDLIDDVANSLEDEFDVHA